MAIQTRSAASTSHCRVTRSTASFVKQAQFARTRAVAAALSQQIGNKELASLKFSEPSAGYASPIATSPSNSPLRYSLRSGDKGTIGVKKSNKRRKSKETEYDGPGYSTAATKEFHPRHKDCVICAESKEW